MLETIRAFWKDEDGLSTVEYALLLALLVVAAIGVWTAFGGPVRQSVANDTNAMPAPAP